MSPPGPRGKAAAATLVATALIQVSATSDYVRCLQWVKSEPQRHIYFTSAVRGRADGIRRKRTIARRSSAIGGIAVVAGGEPDGLLLATSGSRDSVPAGFRLLDP